MPYCPNCGSQVGKTHHYCGSCGKALSEIAETETDPPMAVDRDGFLSPRSLSYIHDLLSDDRTVDRDSVSHKQLQQDVSAGLADFARIAVIEDLNLLLLWSGGSNSAVLDIPVEDMNSHQLNEWLATLGLHRVLRLYDNSIGTDFEDEFSERLQEFMDLTKEELDTENGS